MLNSCTAMLETLAEAAPSGLLAARLQMAWTLVFHIVFACLGVGMPVLMLFAEWRFLRTGDTAWRTLARRWSRVFLVLFTVGAVSGTVLSFELGLLWPEFMGRFGSIFGFPLTVEGIAFFLEAIFLGAYLYGWDRLPPRAHWLCGFPLAIGGAASAFLIVTVNAWMNTPQGFTMEGGKVVDVQPQTAMFNPATFTMTAHTILSAYMVTGFLVGAVHAVMLLRGQDSPSVRRGMALGLALGLILAPAEAFVGDLSAKMVAREQPVKFAAMEGHFKTQANAPLIIGGIPDTEARDVKMAIRIPGLLSFMAFGDTNAEVRGLDDFPIEDQPPVVIVHLAFQAMVGIGFAFLGLSAWAAWSVIRRRTLPDGRLFLWAVIASGPASVVAMEAGWIVTEVGRQPWIVRGVMRTSEALTAAPGIWWTFTASLLIYALLAVATAITIALIAKTPYPEEAS